MRINKSRHNRHATEIDFNGPLRNRQFRRRPDGFNSVITDQDHRILDHLPRRIHGHCTGSDQRQPLDRLISSHRLTEGDRGHCRVLGKISERIGEMFSTQRPMYAAAV